MACGATLTLKRNLEFDPIHSPGQTTPKRRRCMPMTLSPSTPPTKQHQVNPSPFGEVGQKITSEQIAASLGQEIRRMHRRKQLQYSGIQSPQSMSPPHESNSNTCISIEASPSSSTGNMFSALSPSKRETPLFTFKQVSMICERMLKDREEQIKNEYNTVLTCKLAEQYEAFLKFNHDQIQKRFTNDVPVSYVS